MIFDWLRGLLVVRAGRLLGTAAGVALTVALLAVLSSFMQQSAAEMTSVAVSTVPVDWQVRLGLHWLTEHFLAYFAVTSIVCVAWPRPMAVAAWLVPFAVLLEALQGLTADRVPDLPTALFGAAGVASAALLADLALWLRRGVKTAVDEGPKA